jgi:hypothetical protein
VGGSKGVIGPRRRWAVVLVLLVGALSMMGAVLSLVLGGAGAARPASGASASSASAEADAPAPEPTADEAARAEPPAAPGDGIPHGDRGLPRGETIRGRVTDAAGAPVADVVLFAAYRDTSARPHEVRPSARVRSETDGSFVLGPLERRAYWVVGVHERKGVAYTAGVFPGSWVDLALSPPATVRGVVTAGGTGEPVAGATVVLKDAAFQHETTTDAEGRYVLSPLPPTINAWAGHQLIVAAAAFRRADRTGLLLAGGKDYEIDVALVKGATLAGRVADARTLGPVKGAVVAEGWEPWDKTARAGEDGAYRLENVDVRPNLVFQARAEGYLPQARQSAGTDRLDFDLEASLCVEGRVLDATDRPLAGARVRLHRIRFAGDAQGGDVVVHSFGGPFGSPSEPPGATTTTTGADGTFRFADVAPGEVGIVAFHRDTAPAEKGPLTVPVGGPAPPPVDVTMPRGFSVEGVVRDGAGEPIPSVRVQMSQWGGGQGYRFLQNYMWSETPESWSDEQGRFTIRGATPGQHWLGASDPTWGWAGLQVEGVEGQRISDLVISYAGAAIAGVLLTADGRPVPGANVNAQGPKNAASGRQWRWTQTDGLGRFRLAGLEQGNYDLHAWTAWGQPEPLKDVPAGSEGIELKLAPSQVLRGVVTSIPLGGPLDRFQLIVQGTSGPGRSPNPASRRGGMQWQGEVRSPDGRFERPVGPGEYTIVIRAAGHAPLALRGVIVEENVEPQPLVLRLEQGGGIRGVAVDVEGKPVVNGAVQARVHRAPGQPADPVEWLRGAHDATDDRGRFFIEGLPPGTYLVALHLGTRGSAQAVVAVPGAEMVTQDLRLQPTGIVTLKAVDEEGNPVEGVYFQFHDDQGQWVGFAGPTNAQGFATSQAMRMGPAVGRAYHAEREPATVDVTVASGKTVHVEVTLRKKQE